MLQLKLKELILARGHLFPHAWLVKKVGLHPSTATKLLNNSKKSLMLKELGDICVHLQCTPNDILYWGTDTKSGNISAEHPLMTTLKAPGMNEGWEALFKNLPADELNRIYEEGQARLNELGK